uniref:CX domain-containing protein n=1 Tax=Caenorhabditis tropicalis TaxID=1561998 RepID=A0A1I7V3N5_9PELO
MQTVVPKLANEQFTTFLRIYQACYAYCVGSINGFETRTDNYHDAMNGKMVSTKYGSFSFDKSGNVLTNYAVFTVDPADMSFVPVMNLKSNPKEECDTYNCFELTPTVIADLLWTLKDMEAPDDCVARNSCVNYIRKLLMEFRGNMRYSAHIIGALLIIGAITTGIVLIVRHRRYVLFTWKLF